MKLCAKSPIAAGMDSQCDLIPVVIRKAGGYEADSFRIDHDHHCEVEESYLYQTRRFEIAFASLNEESSHTKGSNFVLQMSREQSMSSEKAC